METTAIKVKTPKYPEIPKNVAEATLKLIDEAEGILSQTSDFREWRRTHSLNGITPDVYDRELFNQDPQWRAALTLYDLRNWRRDIDTISKSNAYYLNLYEFVRKLKRQRKSQEETREDIRSFASEVATINKSAKKNTSIISREFLNLFLKGGNIFLGELPEDKREKIEELQVKGQLLYSSTIGLKGGEVFFKKFCLALAQTLSEQSQYYGTDKKLLGVPDNVMSEIAPIVSPRKNEIGGKLLDRPFILIRYPDFARTLWGYGKSKQIGSFEIRDLKSYLDALDKKKYLVKENGGFIAIPLFIRYIHIDNNGKEDGSILELSPHFTRYINSFAKYPSDMMERLNGKQTDITMCLYITLLNARGKDTYRRIKKDLLDDIALASRYQTHPNDREKDFQSAIQRMKDIKLISDYTEEGIKSPVSIFTFNPNFLKEKYIANYGEKVGK